MSTQSCKTCKWLNVKPDAVGRIVVRKGNAYQCVVEVPLPSPLPDSIKKNWPFRWPSARSYMVGHEGKTCPTWEQRK